jgi:hypothetical protein
MSSQKSSLFPLTTGLCLATLCATPAFAQSAAETDQIRAQIEALRAEQARIDELQRRTDESLRALEARLAPAGAAPAAAAAPVAASAPAKAASVPSRLAVTGDVRLRGQGDYSDEDGRARNSSQVRARIGATYKVSDRISIGGRLVTGDGDDPNSTDVQLSNFVDDLQVTLDLAYAQIDFGDLKIYGGKVPQPFTRTDLVWDSDVNPQGISSVYKHALGNGGAFRANALAFVIDEQAAADDSTMIGGQLGYDSPAFGAWKYDISAAYYDYDLRSVVGGDSGDFRTNLLDVDGSYLSDFNLSDLVVGATWTGAGDRWPVRLLGDYVTNHGAATDADTGYGADFIVGRASKAGDWRVTYGYSKADADAVLAAFSHDNTSIGSNYRLHSLTLDYVPAPRTMVSAIWYHYRPEDALYAGSNDPSDWLDRLRLAFLMSF